MSKEPGNGEEGRIETKLASNPVSVLTRHNRENFNILQLESLKSYPPDSLIVTLHHGIAGETKLCPV